MFDRADRWVKKVASHLQYDDQEDLRSELYLTIVKAGEDVSDRLLHNKLKATVRKWWRHRKTPIPVEAIYVEERSDHVQEIETDDLIQHCCHGPLDREIVKMLLAGHSHNEISSHLEISPDRVAKIKKKVAARVKKITQVRPSEQS